MVYTLLKDTTFPCFEKYGCNASYNAGKLSSYSELRLLEEWSHSFFGFLCSRYSSHVPSQSDVRGQQVAHADHACHYHHGESQPVQNKRRAS